MLRGAQHEAAGVYEHGEERALKPERVRRLHALHPVVVVIRRRHVRVHVEAVQAHRLTQLQRQEQPLLVGRCRAYDPCMGGGGVNVSDAVSDDGSEGSTPCCRFAAEQVEQGALAFKPSKPR